MWRKIKARRLCLIKFLSWALIQYREYISLQDLGKPKEVQSAAPFKIRLTDLYYCTSDSASLGVGAKWYLLSA
jgi:hypothetical protein